MCSLEKAITAAPCLFCAMLFLPCQLSCLQAVNVIAWSCESCYALFRNDLGNNSIIDCFCNAFVIGFNLLLLCKLEKICAYSTVRRDFYNKEGFFFHALMKAKLFSPLRPQVEESKQKEISFTERRKESGDLKSQPWSLLSLLSQSNMLSPLGL